MTTDLAPPPDDISGAQRALWTAVLKEHEMADAELRIFADALRLAARADQAAVSVDEHGVVIADRYGVLKTNPAAELEIRCRTASARLLAGLKLTLEEETQRRPNGSRPGPKPGLKAAGYK